MSGSFTQLLEERQQASLAQARWMRLAWITVALLGVAAIAVLILRGDPAKLPVNPNTATRAQLVTLPEVGPEIASRIIDNRPYTGADDLQKKVKGIGPRTLEKMRPRLDFDGDGKADAP